MVWNKTKEGCQLWADAVPSQPFKIRLPRAGTFLKDLISNNTHKLLSGNLSFTISHHQSECRGGEILLPSPTCHRQLEPGMTLACFQQGERSTPTGAAAGGINERNSVKEMQNHTYNLEIYAVWQLRVSEENNYFHFCLLLPLRPFPVGESVGGKNESGSPPPFET